MATRNLVPRNSGEGGVGRLGKPWATGYFDNLFIGDLEFSMDQNLTTQDSVEFVSGNFISGLTLNGVDVAGLGTSVSQVQSGAAEFVFFSDVLDNIGVTNKTYYNTPDPNLYLSSVEVTTAENLRVEMQWDGPNDDYMGSAYIEGQQIPFSNIQQLGNNTRRFIGFIDNLNIEGKTQLSGEANGRTIIIPLSEAGGGPEAVDIRIDPITAATPKPGENIGSTHLKQGDSLNVYVDFDTNDVSSIKVLGSGLAQQINFANYSLAESNGVFTATIPITVSNESNGSHGVAVQAVNAFGSTGDVISSEVFAHGSGTRDVDQIYPSISASNPTSYNGRTDGLREGESTTFNNSISNWNSSSDLVSYTTSNDISITDPAVFQSVKTVDYVQGIYNNSNNITISASKTSNGATDTDSIKVKIANGPQITGASLQSIASSATSPHSIGTSEIKAGDTVQSEIFIDGKGTSINNISLSVRSEGVSNGSQTSYSSSYSKTTLSDGSYKFTVPINVYGSIGSSTRDGSQPAAFIARNNFGTLSDKFTTSDTATLNNGSIPSVNISSISYPSSQQAIKSSESASISNTVSNFDSIIYSSPNNQLSITDSTSYQSSKTAAYSSGGYNIDSDGGQNNFKVSAIKSSNGITIERQDIVNIANTPLTLSINNLASKLSSSPSGTSDQFYLQSSQLMLNSPTLSLDSSQSNRSVLSVNSSGTGKTSNSYIITVSDSDTKGTFSFSVTATNLAGITTNSISTNPNYTLAGFSSRTINASPNSLGAGLADIGTTVSNTSSVTFENVSEGGTAPNGGTIYTYQSYSDGIQLDNSYDVNNKFTICNSSGLTDSDGSFVFNLDKLNRSANTSTSNPASFVISEN
jgi:epidermal growth factor receptor substrate 15